MPRPPSRAGQRPAGRQTPAPENSDEFARLLAEQGRRDFDPIAAGDRVEGTVIAITGASVLVDIGQRSEGVVPLDEVRPEDLGRLRVGDRAEFLVSRISGAGIELSWAVVAHKLDLARIQEAKNAGIPIEGKVSGDNKGGFTVDLPGAKGFVPFSQMELYQALPTAEYIGRTFRFRVIEIRGRDVILSRAALLREEQERERRAILDSLVEGQELSVPVVKIERFGVFVDLGGGINALVPVGEIAWNAQDEAKALLVVGDTVTVKIAEIDRTGQRPRISASMRQTTQDPWVNAPAHFHEGQVVRGRVTRIAPFGAFLEVAPGIEGLLHVSEMSATKRVQSPNEAVRPGQTLDVVVTSIDAPARRMGLSIAQLPDAEIDPEVRARYLDGAASGPGGTSGASALAEAFERARRQAEDKTRKKS